MSSPHDRFFKAFVAFPGVAGEIARYALPDDVTRELDFADVV